jgi:hypothetical protein
MHSARLAALAQRGHLASAFAVSLAIRMGPAASATIATASISFIAPSRDDTIQYALTPKFSGQFVTTSLFGKSSSFDAIISWPVVLTRPTSAWR